MEPQLMDRPPDLRSLLQSLWRRKWLFLAILLSIPAAVYVISSLVTKTYEASALVRLEAVRTDIASLSTPTQANIDTETLLLNTRKVADLASEELGGRETPAAVSEAILTEPLTTGSGAATDLLYVTAQASDAHRAAEIANAYSNAIDEVRTGKALREIDASITDLIAQSQDASDPTAEAEFERQLQLLRGSRSSAQDSTELIQPAGVPDTPISPHPRRNTALAALVALLLALGAVALAERLDRRLRDSAELEPLIGAPLLSVIPRGAFPGERPTPGPVREAFRTLAASLVYFNVEQPISTVIVASPTKGDGKTTVAVHLAVALARDGKRTILIDCDLRHPQVAVRLGIEPAAGVVDVLTEQASLADALVDVDVGDGRLQVLAAGSPPPNPARLLGSQRMDSLLTRLSKAADVVVVDTPPILNVSDAVPLLERVSGTVVVSKVGATSQDAIQRVRQVIETARGNILGAVATGSASAGLYGYGTEYYGDGADLDLESPLPAASADKPAEEPEPEETPEPAEPEAEEAPPPPSAPAEPAPPIPAWRAPTENGQHAPSDAPAPEPVARVDQPTQEWDAEAEWAESEDWEAADVWAESEAWSETAPAREPETAEWPAGTSEESGEWGVQSPGETAEWEAPGEREASEEPEARETRRARRRREKRERRQRRD